MVEFPLVVLDGELAVPCTRNPLSGVEFPLEVRLCGTGDATWC